MTMTVYRIPDLVPILKMKPRAIRKLFTEGQVRGRLVGRQVLTTEDSLKRFLGEPPTNHACSFHKC